MRRTVARVEHVVAVAAIVALGWAACSCSGTGAPSDSCELSAPPPPDTYDCGGGGRMSASIRASAFEHHMRAQWLVATGRAMPATGGSFDDDVTWTDASGDNALVLTHVDRTQRSDHTSRITAALLRKRASDWSEIARIEDGTDRCLDDDATGFERDVLQLTDLDGDGIREATFAYRTGCVSDLSPVDVQLVLIEGEAVYRIWGESWAGDDDDRCAPPRPLAFDDDPAIQLLDQTDPRGLRHTLPWKP